MPSPPSQGTLVTQANAVSIPGARLSDWRRLVKS